MTTVHDPGWFEIRVLGHLEEHWSSWFEGMTVEPEVGGTTLLVGHVADQAALHGLLARLRDLGIPLVSVCPVPPAAPATDTTITTKDDMP